MSNERTVLVNGQNLKAARNSKKIASRAEFHRRLKAANIEIHEDTLSRYEHSPNPPHFAFLASLTQIAEFLGVPTNYLIIDERPIRDCSGVWDASGGDIAVPGHFEYRNEPKLLTARVVVRMEGVNVFGEGEDHDRDPLSFSGIAKENGNVIVGHYSIENPRMHVYGTLNLKFEGCGKRITGFYLGRETGQGTTFILGSLELRLASTS